MPSQDRERGRLDALFFKSLTFAMPSQHRKFTSETTTGGDRGRKDNSVARVKQVCMGVLRRQPVSKIADR